MVKYDNRLYDPEEAVNALCCKLLDNKAELEIRMLLGICYFMQGNMQSARMVFSNLVRDYPKEEEKLKQSHDIFHEEVAYFRKTGTITSVVMLEDEKA